MSAKGQPVRFGKYLVLAKVTEGGMAEVFLAQPVGKPELRVALKTLHRQMSQNKQYAELFVNETRLALLLKHSNVVETYDVGKVDEQYFIAMEYIAGQDVKNIFKRCSDSSERMPVPIALHVAVETLRGLAYAHDLSDTDGQPLNIVHRDVSPSNIRISYDGAVKLIDFGVAQGLVSLQSQIGLVKGKVSYMSPEQVRGMPIDRRSDVFSMGIVLFEMLTQSRLFVADSTFDLMERVRQARVPDILELNPRVPSQVKAIVEKALNREAKGRFDTAAQFADELAHALDRYKFDVRELSFFMQRLFRDESAAERELLSMSAEAPSPPPPPPATPRGSGGDRRTSESAPTMGGRDEDAGSISMKIEVGPEGTATPAPSSPVPTQGSGKKSPLVAIVAVVVLLAVALLLWRLLG
jgi:serine/threonine protein kinase